MNQRFEGKQGIGDRCEILGDRVLDLFSLAGYILKELNFIMKAEILVRKTKT